MALPTPGKPPRTPDIPAEIRLEADLRLYDQENSPFPLHGTVWPNNACYQSVFFAHFFSKWRVISPTIPSIFL